MKLKTQASYIKGGDFKEIMPRCNICKKGVAVRQVENAKLCSACYIYYREKFLGGKSLNQFKHNVFADVLLPIGRGKDGSILGVNAKIFKQIFSLRKEPVDNISKKWQRKHLTKPSKDDRTPNELRRIAKLRMESLADKPVYRYLGYHREISDGREVGCHRYGTKELCKGWIESPNLKKTFTED